MGCIKTENRLDPEHGLGAFQQPRARVAWVNPNLSGFGGEEEYTHVNSRQVGWRTLCLWFRWMQSFGRPTRVPFPSRLADEFRTHLLGHAELGLDHRRAVEHFSRYLQAEQVGAVLREVLRQKAETAMEPSGLR
jgi:hypothetical protein